jgi:hypothetical protein
VHISRPNTQTTAYEWTHKDLFGGGKTYKVANYSQRDTWLGARRVTRTAGSRSKHPATMPGMERHGGPSSGSQRPAARGGKKQGQRHQNTIAFNPTKWGTNEHLLRIAAVPVSSPAATLHGSTCLCSQSATSPLAASPVRNTLVPPFALPKLALDSALRLCQQV